MEPSQPTTYGPYFKGQAPRFFPSLKPTFFDTVSEMDDLDHFQLLQIARDVHVDVNVINDMYLTRPVHRKAAKKILEAFTERTGYTWDFDTIKVALLPTFSEVCKLHNLDLLLLIEHIERMAGCPVGTLDRLVNDKPVNKMHAGIAVGVLSQLSGNRYGLDTVDVALLPEQKDPTNAASH